MVHRFLFLCLLCVWEPSAAAHAEEAITGPAAIIDGDTLRVGGERVRLWGIDALEAGQTCMSDHGEAVRCGQAATTALFNLVGGNAVTCTPLSVDPYGRTVARCTAGSADLAEGMVKEGWAFVNPRFGVEYLDLQRAARAGRRGAWGMSFTWPWECRKTRQCDGKAGW